MSVYITGDCHGDFSRFSNKVFDYTNCQQEKDFMIICGDFGGVWDSGIKGKTDNTNKESRTDSYWLNWLANKPITFIVVPGNHENYNFVENFYPIEKYHEARVRKIRDNIIWVERGEIINLNNKKFFCFGGAQSHDTKNRVKNINWWKRELPNSTEYKKLENFIYNNHNEKIYIVTHECPSAIKQIFFPNTALLGFDDFSNQLNILYDMKNWKYWFCGHLHFDEHRYKLTLLYKNIYKIEE